MGGHACGLSTEGGDEGTDLDAGAVAPEGEHHRLHLIVGEVPSGPLLAGGGRMVTVRFRSTLVG